MKFRHRHKQEGLKYAVSRCSIVDIVTSNKGVHALCQERKCFRGEEVVSHRDSNCLERQCARSGREIVSRCIEGAIMLRV